MNYQNVLGKVDTNIYEGKSNMTTTVISTYDKRLGKVYNELWNRYHKIYGHREDASQQFQNLLNMMKQKDAERKDALKKIDAEREENQGWFLSQNQVGYMLYIDLFAENLTGLKQKIKYLHELGVTYIHLMPFLKMPDEHNDGGYAVSSYTEIHKPFGTMKQFESVVDLCRELGMSVCSDFVINHTSKEHEWAQKARQGMEEYQDMYFMFDTYDIPAQYDKTVPEVFPKVSPGNFTYYEDMNKHVFTSFYEFQWDLNYQNPRVFNEIANCMMELANKGVEIFRLDAIPFMWKEIGTTCRNLDEIHDLIEMYRYVMKVVCPGVIFKGEAIVQPQEILSYFGGMEGKECHTMYNASFMVLLWNSIATKETAVMTEALCRYPQLPEKATWINYVRCHDDIGWGFDNDVLGQQGINWVEHTKYILKFFKGDFHTTFSKGEYYEFDEWKFDGRTSGTLASLCGLEWALESRDAYQQELAEKRIKLLHSIILSFSGIPVIYSGDELAQLNDWNYLTVENKAHDSRWLHRPSFDWEKAKKRHDVSTVEGRIFTDIKNRIETRKAYDIFRSDVPTYTIRTGADQVFTYFKKDEHETFVGLANFSEYPVYVPTHVLHQRGIWGNMQDLIQGKYVDVAKETILVGPYETLWLYQ